MARTCSQGTTMSKINNRNYQLNLAYADGDLRKPKHDEIMHWLDAWVHESDNLFKLIDSRFNRRSAITRGVLDDDSENAYRAKGAHERSQLQIYLDADSKPSKAEVDTAWPDEPRRVARYLDSQWEWPLKGDRGMPVGFCDLYAAYEVGDTLRKVKE